MNILKQEVIPLHALPVFKESTDFVLTKDEMNIVTSEEYRDGTEGEGVKLTKSDKVLENEKLERVKIFILSRFSNYVNKVLAIKNSFYLTQSWCSKNGKGSSHHLHTHPNTILSCIYYACANEDNGGDLRLQMDRSRLQEAFYIRYEKLEDNIYNSCGIDLPVKTGDLVMFPGWINHKSLPNESDEDRIIIGTNYFVTGKFGHQTTKDYIEIG